MKTFVVGGTGVLGHRLLPILAETTELRVLARNPSRVPQVPAGTRLDVVIGDLLDPDIAGSLPDILSGCDVVAHVATAIPHDPGAPGAWEANTRLRTEGTAALLAAALSAGARRYVQQSIVMAYADGGDRWLSEDSPLDHSAGRASTTEPVIEMERLVRTMAGKKLAWTVLRGGQFIGGGTAQDDLVARLKRGEVSIPCGGENFVSLVHVADMAEAVALACRSTGMQGVFNVCAEPIRYRDYVMELARRTSSPPPSVNAAVPCPPSFRCSSNRIRKLGWRDAHPIWPE